MVRSGARGSLETEAYSAATTRGRGLNSTRREDLAPALVAGVLGLVYGGFSYTRETDDAKLGPLQISISEVNVPVRAGVVLLIAGAGLLVARRSVSWHVRNGTSHPLLTG